MLQSRTLTHQRSAHSGRALKRSLMRLSVVREWMPSSYLSMAMLPQDLLRADQLVAKKLKQNQRMACTYG
eukprot:5431384-Karenia_brevis.AAC.1